MNEIERDAYRFMEAKLDYGKGAGTKRKLIKAELERKFSDDAYKNAFNDALLNVDTDKIMKRIEARKDIERAYNGVKTAGRTVYRGANFYSNHKKGIDKLLDFIYILFGNKS